jgi:hypothetical protein
MTSRIELLDGEKVTAQGFAYRRVGLGGWVAGMLYLTTSRLLFAPTWFSFGLGKRIFTRDDIHSVLLEHSDVGALPNLWTMKVQVGDRTEQFGFGGLPTDRQRATTESWIEAVKQWPTT